MIKIGTTVKAWDDGVEGYVVGELADISRDPDMPYGVGEFYYENIIEIPPSLAKQLEDLGS